MPDDSPRLDTLDRNDLLKEAFELARDQGITDQAGWNELIEELIQDHLEIGELDPDQDLEGVRVLMQSAWDEYRREAGEESSRAVDEDPESPHA